MSDMSDVLGAVARPEHDLQRDIAALHSPVVPADVRPGEQVEGTISAAGGRSIVCRGWRISPFAVELLIPEANELREGDVASLALRVGHQTIVYKRQVVSLRHVEDGRSLVGFRLRASEVTQAGEGADNRRALPRWKCNPKFAPTAVTQDAVTFGNTLHFRFVDVSGAGLRLSTSLRNKHLVPGMRLDLDVQLPGVGATQLSVSVFRVEVTGVDGELMLLLGVRLRDPSSKSLTALGQYALKHPDPDAKPSARDIKKSGLKLRSISSGVSFSWVNSAEDLERVLALRHKAYLAAGKIATTASAKEMTDDYDLRSRIVLGSYRNQAVASIRLAYGEDGQKLEMEKYVEFPQTFPPRSQIVEISRACTDPDFRGVDLLFNLFSYVLLGGLQAKRRYLTGWATDDLLRVYRSVGCIPQPFRIENVYSDGLHRTVFLCDLHRVIAGLDVYPFLYEPLVERIRPYVDARYFTSMPWHDQLRVRALKGIFGPMKILRQSLVGWV